MNPSLFSSAKCLLEFEVMVGPAGVGAEDQLVGGDAQRGG